MGLYCKVCDDFSYEKQYKKNLPGKKVTYDLGKILSFFKRFHEPVSLLFSLNHPVQRRGTNSFNILFFALFLRPFREDQHPALNQFFHAGKLQLFLIFQAKNEVIIHKIL